MNGKALYGEDETPKTVRVITCRVREPAKVERLSTKLEAWQSFVGGYIELVPCERPYVNIICNEEALQQGRAFNRTVMRGVGGVHLYGDFFIVRHTPDGEAVDLTDDDLQLFTKRFTNLVLEDATP